MLGILLKHPRPAPWHRRRSARSPNPRASRAGFTLIEILIALVTMAVIYAIALPAIGRTRTTASLHNARHTLVSSISLARATAIRFGRTAVLHLDSDHDRVWVEADTTMAGTGEVVVLGYFDFAEELNVDLRSDRSSLCFNARGIGTTSATCTQSGYTLIALIITDRIERVYVSPTGFVLNIRVTYE